MVGLEAVGVIKLETPSFPINTIAKGGFGQGIDLRNQMSLVFTLEPKYFEGDLEKLTYMILGSFKVPLKIVTLSVNQDLESLDYNVRCLLVGEEEETN